MLRKGELLLEIEQLLLQARNLQMAIAQLLEWIHKSIGIGCCQGAHLVAAAAGYGVVVGLEILCVEAFKQW